MLYLLHIQSPHSSVISVSLWIVQSCSCYCSETLFNNTCASLSLGVLIDTVTCTNAKWDKRNWLKLETSAICFETDFLRHFQLLCHRAHWLCHPQKCRHVPRCDRVHDAAGGCSWPSASRRRTCAPPPRRRPLAAISCTWHDPRNAARWRHRSTSVRRVRQTEPLWCVLRHFVRWCCQWT